MTTNKYSPVGKDHRNPYVECAMKMTVMETSVGVGFVSRSVCLASNAFVYSFFYILVSVREPDFLPR